jgi:TIR domain
MSKPNEKNIVFLSHSSKDKRQLVPFKKALEEKTNGTVQFFLSSDGQSIPLGHNWVASVEHSLDEAKLAFLLLTTNSVDSTWVAFEACFMHAKDIRVIPVALPGLDLGQVPPPIGLLQGFNMHSHDAMNNFFEILNQEFQHQHKPTFTNDDYQKLFGSDSAFGSGFFGEYSGFVKKIVFDGKTRDQTLISSLKMRLAKENIRLIEKSNAENSEANCPGLSVQTNAKTNWFRIEIHREMLSIILTSVCSVLKELSVADKGFEAKIDFIQGIVGAGSGVELPAHAFGTEFEVESNGSLRFRRIILNQIINNPLFIKSMAAFDVQDIRDIVVGLFESGILEFRPRKEIDPLLANVANVVFRMQRKY